jgi:hypothetical protein
VGCVADGFEMLSLLPIKILENTKQNFGEPHPTSSLLEEELQRSAPLLEIPRHAISMSYMSQKT